MRGFHRSVRTSLDHNQTSLVAQPEKSLPTMKATHTVQCRFSPWVGKIPWSRKWQPSFLAWRIPWTEEPGGLQSMGTKESDRTERLTQIAVRRGQKGTSGRGQPSHSGVLACLGTILIACLWEC